MARELERRLEGLMEGFFAKIFRSGLQPVEVGRRILREMEENRTVSVNRVYAPNDFQVSISAEDFERFEPMAPGLQREFADMVIDSAKQRRWNLMGMPVIAFQREETLGKGEFRVEASLRADPAVGAPRASTRRPSEDDPSLTRAISLGTAERLGIPPAQARLVVLDESGEVKDTISITKEPVVIGRLSSNDIVLGDPNVSRRHAEIRREDGRWVLIDLGSTNGTLVNGKLAKQHRLKDGDSIAFGTSDLLFKTTRDG